MHLAPQLGSVSHGDPTDLLRINRDMLNSQMQEFYNEFLRAVETYRQIDDFVGDANDTKPAVGGGGA